MYLRLGIGLLNVSSNPVSISRWQVVMRYLFNWVNLILPTSSCFGLKRSLARFAGILVAEGVSINGHCWFFGNGVVEIARDTWIGPGCRFYTANNVVISIGERCDIAPEVSFVTGSHNMDSTDRRAGSGYCLSIKVAEGCWIGARSMCLGGVEIGRHCVVGAGSLVLHSLPENGLYAGSPAVRKKDL